MGEYQPAVMAANRQLQAPLWDQLLICQSEFYFLLRIDLGPAQPFFILMHNDGACIKIDYEVARKVLTWSDVVAMPLPYCPPTSLAMGLRLFDHLPSAAMLGPRRRIEVVEGYLLAMQLQLLPHFPNHNKRLSFKERLLTCHFQPALQTRIFVTTCPPAPHLS